MPRRRASRVLIVGDDTLVWSVRHRHERAVGTMGSPPAYLDCREVLMIRRRGARGQLSVVFRAGADRFVPDGLLASGAIACRDGRALNLHEPGTARAFLDEALNRGWRPDQPEPAAVDGWALFDAVHARRHEPRA